MQLREIREQARLTQRDAAAKLGVTHSHLSKVERGRVAVGLDLARGLARIYGVPVDRLFPYASGKAMVVVTQCKICGIPEGYGLRSLDEVASLLAGIARAGWRLLPDPPPRPEIALGLCPRCAQEEEREVGSAGST